MRTYFLRSFGCQMNEHDAERIRALLEGDGLLRSTSLDDADVLVYNTCTVRQERRRPPGRATWATPRGSSARPAPRRARHRLPAAGRARPTSSSASRSSTWPWGRRTCTACRSCWRPLWSLRRRARGPASSTDGPRSQRRAAGPPRAALPGLGADHVRLHQLLLLLHRALRARPGAQPGPDGRGRRGARPGRPTACARSHCSARTSTPTATTCAAATARRRRRLRRPAGTAPRRRRRGCARVRFMTSHPQDLSDELVAADRRAADRVRARAPARPVGHRPRAGRHGTAGIHSDAVSGAVAGLARSSAGRRRDHRPHRRLSRRDRRRLRRHPGARRGGRRSTPRSRSSSRRGRGTAAADTARASSTTDVARERVAAPDRAHPAPGARPRRRRWVGRRVEVLVEGQSRRRRPACAAAAVRTSR